ncbi:MOSC domain-containing protein [Pseudonocardia yunnanensis]|uniref:MOSC domain-containing protein n=1 Tax=Pseudonocardia yunnanensis TaxID=58107 RepID=A0ABW4EPV0_9PSEU
MAKVASLMHYPIKGCAGTVLSNAAVTVAGLAHDRSFMVVDDDHVFRNQQSAPLLAVIRPEIGDDGEVLTLHAPGLPALSIEVQREGDRTDVGLYGIPYTGIDQGEPAAAWLTEVLGSRSRLVRVPPDHVRTTDGETPGRAGYADCAVLLVSMPSLDLLHTRLVEQGGEALPMDRFRPNIVVDGWGEPHIEDRLRRVTIGSTRFGYAKLAIRCSVTMVDQETGTPAGPEPMRTLASYRRSPEGGVTFGTKLAVLKAGDVKVGDELQVEHWAAETT